MNEREIAEKVFDNWEGIYNRYNYALAVHEAIEKEQWHDLNERDIFCPFCSEGEFDKPGLKDHLKWCGKHLRTIDI